MSSQASGVKHVYKLFIPQAESVQNTNNALCALKSHVGKWYFIHKLMNTFTMQFYTPLTRLSICYGQSFHGFHSTYNNHHIKN